MSDETHARKTLNILFHLLQIAKLYQTSFASQEESKPNKNKFAAFAYLEENGTMADIQHLDYVAQHDPNKNIRTRAIEVRAIIRNRNNNQGNTTPPVVT